MRQAIVLIAAAMMVAACAAPDSTADLSLQPTYPAGAQGRPAAPDIARWTAYRQFNFDAATVDVSPSDLPKLQEIVGYLANDHSLDIGIDGTLGTEGVSQADRDLNGRRAASVRRALMDTGAGVASYRIKMGPYANPDRRKAGHVQVLVGPRTSSPEAAS